MGGQHAGDELGVAPVVLAAGVRRGPLHPGDGGDGAVEAEGAQLARHAEPGGAALVAGPGLLEPEGPLRDLGGVRPEVAVHHLAGEGVERRGGDRSRVDVQADGGNMGHGKPPPRRCGKGYRTGRYSKPIVAPRARGKKLRRGGGDPNGFLISSCYPPIGSSPLAIPIFQMKQKIPFSAVDMQSKWDYLLHLERGAPESARGAVARHRGRTPRRRRSPERDHAPRWERAPQPHAARGRLSKAQ